MQTTTENQGIEQICKQNKAAYRRKDQESGKYYCLLDSAECRYHSEKTIELISSPTGFGNIKPNNKKYHICELIENGI